jgi:hypothetical protein
MEQYTELSEYVKSGRKKQGLGNFLYARYADDFVVLCNGNKGHVEGVVTGSGTGAKRTRPQSVR